MTLLLRTSSRPRTSTFLATKRAAVFSLGTLSLVALLSCADLSPGAPKTTPAPSSAKENQAAPEVAKEETRPGHVDGASSRGNLSPSMPQQNSAEPLLPALDFGKGGQPAPRVKGEAASEHEGGGGLGLSGVGEGGGGKVTTGASAEVPGMALESARGFGAGHGRLGGSHAAGSGRPKMAARENKVTQGASGVAAGEWDDNANYREFQKFLVSQKNLAFHQADVSQRRFFVVQDAEGKPVPNCALHVLDKTGRSVTLTTASSGRALFFPRAEGFSEPTLEVSTSCQGSKVSATFSLLGDDAVVALRLDTARVLSSQKTIDIVFILDTTGSMSEEIAQLKSTIVKVAETLSGANVKMRIGLVEYRDREDLFLTRLHQMTTDVKGFVERVDRIDANGGGDTPEDVNEGLFIALNKINWNEQSVARLAFLIGDAPPQLTYQDSVSYTKTMKQAAHQGVRLHTIAASGMDGLGQVVFRQVAQYTGGTNMFVLRGGAGPESVGGGDPKTSCGGTHQNYSTNNLDELIRAKVRGELASLDADPLIIAGLDRDEKAKPCDERVVRLQR